MLIFGHFVCPFLNGFVSVEFEVAEQTDSYNVRNQNFQAANLDEHSEVNLFVYLDDLFVVSDSQFTLFLLF